MTGACSVLGDSMDAKTPYQELRRSAAAQWKKATTDFFTLLERG